MLGTPVALGSVLLRIRKVIKMEDPHELGKYLGCYHRIAEKRCQSTGEVTIHVEWDMSAYNRDAVTRYEKEDFRDGKPFFKAATPFAPKQDARTFESLMGTEGG